MAEEKKKKTGGKKSAAKPKKSSADKNSDKKPAKGKKNADNKELIAAKQTRSLIMFMAAVFLAAIICIPGDMIWLAAHNAVRGFFSILSLYWSLLLIFTAVVTMIDIDKKLPKLWFKVGFISGFAVALNACIYVFTGKGELDVHTAFEQGIEYHGGGILGFAIGAPFVKLFGVIPARILIILIMMTLLIVGFDISVKKWYFIIISKISEWIRLIVENIKSRSTVRQAVRIADDAYFDDDMYEGFDIGSEAFGRAFSNRNDDDEFEEVSLNQPRKVNEKILPQSPVFSADTNDIIEIDEMDKIEDVVEDADDFDAIEAILNDPDALFDSIRIDEPQAADRQDDYSIDIDIDSPMPDSRSRKRSEKQTPKFDLAKMNQSIDDDDLDGIFDDEMLDMTDSEFKSEAVEIASEINKSKNTDQGVSIDDKKSHTRDKKAYKYPPTTLLSAGKKSSVNYDAELKENAKKLIETLESFSVKAKIVGYCRGPSITRYEIQPAPGVKISKITGLSDDIALNLAADGVRMEAPIPGKPAIGIEIPNKNITSVTIRELLESAEFNKNMKTKKLECVLGRDVAGKIITTDLAKMPHLLIAGTTGSGKSVCVNSILMSILFRASPDEVKMILIDPKLVEFSKYKGIPHLLIPVVSDAKKAAGALNWAVNEMEERYKEFSLYNVKDIDSYNKMVDKNLAVMTPEELEEEENGEVVDGEFIPPRAKKKMPKIVIAIDELADLMMVAPGEVEDSICRLAQKARAAGMHLVIATQRPSVNVITGVIKANIPSRISLKVASYVDSKTILDTGGGEKLIGRGDMLYNPVGAPKPIRVQGGFSSDEDIERVTDFIKGNGKSDYDSDISEQIEQFSETIGVKGSKDSADSSGADVDDSDPMLEDAIKLVVEAGQASTSLLQRRLRLGYARAGRLIDTMEQMGIVGPHEGSKSRKVLMTEQQFIERQISGSVE